MKDSKYHIKVPGFKEGKELLGPRWEKVLGS